MESRPAPRESSGKRPRSPSGDFHPVASKVPKNHSNHLQINYLARQYPDNLPLVSVDDTMTAILHLVGEYDGVLQRHESIAGNLGACPLGPILIKRFERLFDGPPRVLKSHGKEGHTVTWLDVVEFAKNKPEQFNLEKTRNGVRVCQFYTKQSRVEISEEDFVLIASGMPQKMIPPQPIIEDEEKELGALEILEKNLQQIVSVADQVSARARQLNHRLKNRRTAIIARRESDATLHSQLPGSLSPWRDANGSNAHSPSGFVAVNANSADPSLPEDAPLPSQFVFSHSNTDNVTIINGTSIKGASPTTRAELMKKFFTTADRQARGYDDATATQLSRTPRPRPRTSESGSDHAILNPTPATVAIPNTPSSLLPPPKSNHTEKDDGGPHKMEMVARMEELQRGERIIPPCDRCRRLHMDCLKNLTACMGCTKKHAKCSWKDVKEDEIREIRARSRPSHEVSGDEASKDAASAPSSAAPLPAPASSIVSGPAAAPAPAFVSAPAPVTAPAPTLAPTPLTAEPERRQESEHNADSSFGARRESAPTTGHAAGPSMSRDLSPQRAVSEIQGTDPSIYGRHGSPPRHGAAPDDDDHDANSRLMQAIWDTVDHHNRGAATAPEGKKNDVSQDREREHNMVKA